MGEVVSILRGPKAPKRMTGFARDRFEADILNRLQHVIMAAALGGFSESSIKAAVDLVLYNIRNDIRK
jgi:hypothetical protein